MNESQKKEFVKSGIAAEEIRRGADKKKQQAEWPPVVKASGVATHLPASVNPPKDLVLKDDVSFNTREFLSKEKYESLDEDQKEMYCSAIVEQYIWFLSAEERKILISKYPEALREIQKLKMRRVKYIDAKRFYVEINLLKVDPTPPNDFKDFNKLYLCQKIQFIRNLTKNGFIDKRKLYELGVKIAPDTIRSITKLIMEIFNENISIINTKFEEKDEDEIISNNKAQEDRHESNQSDSCFIKNITFECSPEDLIQAISNIFPLIKGKIQIHIESV